MENDICSSYFQLYCEIFIYMRPVKKDGPELQFYFTVFACVNKSKNVSTSNCQKAKKDGWVENNGFEPLTPCLQSRCSSQLS